MALSVLSDGDLASVADVNQYKDLLTGVMTSQAVYLNYRPGSGSTPVLKLDGDGHGVLILGYKTDHSTTAFSLDQTGNFVLAGALSGATTGVFSSYLQAASYRGPSNSAASFYVYDNALGTVRAVRIFIGTTDPSTYTTVNEGDIWIKA